MFSYDTTDREDIKLYVAEAYAQWLTKSKYNVISLQYDSGTSLRWFDSDLSPSPQRSL